MQVAILGCGPAGLLAAKAVKNAGHTPIIFSRKAKSRISGAQYLARPIHNLTEHTVGFQVRFVKMGSGDVYTQRLYEGQDVPVRSSWHNFEDGKLEDAWSMQECYELLWGEFVDSIVDMPFTHTLADALVTGADMVVSSIPRWVLDGRARPDPEAYPHRKIWVVSGEGVVDDLSDNTIYYNGMRDGGTMYRMSNIRGNKSAEFTQPIEGGVEIMKPIVFQGEDRYPTIVKVGRYGAWSKMQLAHHAYSAVLERLRPDVSPQIPGV